MQNYISSNCVQRTSLTRMVEPLRILNILTIRTACVTEYRDLIPYFVNEVKTGFLEYCEWQIYFIGFCGNGIKLAKY